MISNFTIIKPAVMAVTLALLSSTSFAKTAFDAEKEQLVAVFSSDNQLQIRESAKALAWSGISDTAVYDIIEEKLLEGYLSTDKGAVETNAWYAKALSYSGQEKYRKTLATISSSTAPGKLKKHAKRALKSLTEYQTWNPIIRQGLDNTGKNTLDQTRIMNLLNSQQSELIRVAAKRIYWQHANDTVVLDSASNLLKNTYNKVDASDKVLIDAYAWICKALAQSKNEKYKPVLEEVRDNSTNSKLRKYAKKYANYR